MRNKYFAFLAALFICFSSGQTLAEDNDAVQLLQLSLSCPAAGREMNVKGYHVFVQTSYEFNGNAKEFAITETDQQIATQADRTKNYSFINDYKVRFSDLADPSLDGPKVKLVCAHKDEDCIEWRQHIGRQNGRDVVARDGTEEMTIEFCKRETAEDFVAALNALKGR